jgi:PleD family two-component response regulator
MQWRRFASTNGSLSLSKPYVYNSLRQRGENCCRICSVSTKKERTLMSQKTVLSIGQCRPDTAAIGYYLKSQFDVNVLTADLPDQAMAVLEANPVDLVMINRKLDADGSDGLEILTRIRGGSKSAVPVMLVSNYADWQQKAVEMGAVYGFGKAELNRPETRTRLAAILEA